MIIDGNGNPGRVIRAATPAEADFTPLSTMRVRTAVPASTGSPVTNKDTITVSTTTATTVVEADLSADKPIASIKALTPSIATVSDKGVVTRVGAGVASFVVRTRNAGKIITSQVGISNGQTMAKVVGYAAGSLAAHCADQVDSRIAVRSGTVLFDGPWSDQNTAMPAGTYTRRADCWLSDVDSSGVSISHPKVTMLSPVHYLGAKHHRAYRFISHLSPANVQYNRGLSGNLPIQAIGPGNPAADAYATDFFIGLLDSPLPGDIKPLKVLPKNMLSYLPGIASRIPIVRLLTISRKAGVCETSQFPSAGVAMYVSPETVSRQGFYEPAIAGDSSCPAFIIVNGELVLIGTTTFSGPGNGPWISPVNIDLLQAAMNAVGNPNGYQIQEADFSGFPSFS